MIHGMTLDEQVAYLTRGCVDVVRLNELRAKLERAGKTGKPLTVIVDIDPGIHRTGTASPEATVELVQKIANFRSLNYAGVQFYCGRHQHIVDFKQRTAEIKERTEYLQGILAKLEAAGLKPGIVTGSGTGTHYIDAKLGVFRLW